ncbi:MAG TPA: right-handed parallel beta-helix repeat-containing protein [Candidatus Thermoplasmatota archaeon]|nr:right-handed parallel beta-helix repeat-containing protein [Candidatus Thermoplasmatota archaeon]
MRIRGKASLAVFILVVPTVLVAAPVALAEGGFERLSTLNPVPVNTTVVKRGEHAIWSNGSFRFQHTVTIEMGGRATLLDAAAEFAAGSGGFLVRSGGTLDVLRSTLDPAAGSAYRVLAEAGSTLVLANSTVTGGQGVRVETSKATVDDNTFQSIPLALHLVGTSITVERNTFLANAVGVNQTGGFPVLRANRFEGGTYCVRDWLSDPTIDGNEMLGCSYGIWHERSESLLVNNRMIDKADPPGTGMAVVDTMSPVIRGNNISNWGTGILIRNARAYIRENTIHGNVLDGVRVERNSAPMDITSNHIYKNGRDGIHLSFVSKVPVTDNRVGSNGRHGLYAAFIASTEVRDNTFSGNGGDGVRISPGNNLVLEGNMARSNAGTGFVIGAVSTATLDWNFAWYNKLDGYEIRGASVHLEGGEAGVNGRDGFAVVNAYEVTGEAPRAYSNGGAGFRFAATQGVSMTAPLANMNRDGFLVEHGNENVVLARPTAYANARDGLRSLAGPTSAREGAWVGNAGYGIQNLDALNVVDAILGYWGAPTGPTVAPATVGKGDRVSTGVLFAPFAPGRLN